LGQGTPRGDKLVDPGEARILLRRPVSVEEKVDGANLGLSIGADGRLRAQSRGHYLDWDSQGQWRPLWRWLARRDAALRDALGTSLILFGEWCHAAHSVAYDALPDWFLAFDVYDRTAGRCWSRARRDRLVRAAGIVPVPFLGAGVFTLARLRQLMGRSRVGSGAAEGLYLRWEDEDWLVARAKVVRPGWVMAGDDHWSARSLRSNRLAATAGASANRSSPGRGLP
jgi:hypothetical protein